MRYVDFRDAIAGALRRNRRGLTWPELRDSLDLPYRSPCGEWLKRLEGEIGLTREKGEGRALVWKLRRGKKGA
jgi:hypothetical protein